MPYGDRTGPDGYGPRSGRGRGYCNGYDHPGYMDTYPGMGYGRGYGRGRGGGRGYGRGFGRGYGRGYFRRPLDREPVYVETYPEPTPDQEKTYLQQTLDYLEQEIKTVKDRIKELSKKKD